MKKLTIITCLLAFLSSAVKSQPAVVLEGNKLYKEGKYDEAVNAFDKALQKNPADQTAIYNRANALAKKGDKQAALEGYDQLTKDRTEEKIRQRSYYDKGVVLQQQQQLDESISAWKLALKLDPDDKMTRDNLEKALREKQQQQQQQKQQENKKEQKDKKEKDPAPAPPQSKLTQKQVEQLLKTMEQKEKEVQKKLQQRAASSSQPEKDW